MTEFGLDGANIITRLQKMGGIGMAERVGRNSLGDARLANRDLERLL